METIPEMSVTEVDRVRVTGDPGRVADERPDPEMPERARRRRFTSQYKLDVVASMTAAPAGEKGAVLRREGLYSSHVIEWRGPDARGLAGRARPGRAAEDPRDAQIARLTKEKAKLERELAKARFVVDVRQNFSGALGDDLRGRGDLTRVELVTQTQAIALLAPQIGTRAACAAAGASQAELVPAAPGQPGTVPASRPCRPPRRVQARALVPAERKAILDVLHSDRFADLAPAEALGHLAG